MKPTRLLISLLLFTGLLLLSGCDSKEIFTFPAAYPESTEYALSSPYTNLPNTLDFGTSRECLMYDMPEAAPSIPDFLAHYQAEMEKQDWKGDPSELTETADKLTVTWLDEAHNAGVMVIYTPEMWLAVVCVRNP